MEQNLQFIKLASANIPRVRLDAAQQGNWVKYGTDNLYPQQLIDYKSYSATHQAIINLKTDLITGEGFISETETKTLPDINLLRRLASDYALFNGFALQVIWSRDGNTLAEIRHINFSSLRAGLPNAQGEITTWFYSRNWETWEKEGNSLCQPVAIAGFNPELSTKYPRQIYWMAEYAPEIEFYPLASYNAAIPDILFDFEYGKFKLNSMKNGMFPTLHINVEGEPEAHEKEAFYQSLKRKFSGTDNAAEVLITYGNPGAGQTTITPIEIRGNSGMFREWETQSIQRIISAHRLSSPVLAGLPGSGSLGNHGSEIAIAYEHFYNTVVRPMQINIIASLEKLYAYSNTPYQNLQVANSKPIRFVFSEGILSQILTRNEMRNEIGYGPLGTQDSINHNHNPV
jgi:hypothetical protein